VHDDHVRRQRSKFERSPSQSIDVVLRGSIFDSNVLTHHIAKIAEALPKVIPVGRVVYDAYSLHTADWLLRARRERPCGGRATEQPHELASLHCLPQG
jgi:hypothetical protein